MRVVQNNQMQLGEVDVSRVIFNPKSRDDIPKLLCGLRHLYTNKATRAELFKLLEEDFAPLVNKHTGRPGMTLWSTLVCATLRLDLNIDYDRLAELVNHHSTIREMLGHGSFDDNLYTHQTLKDNISQLTPALLDKVNQIIVKSGYEFIDAKTGKKKAVLTKPPLHGRCDSFVVKTNAHFPTDISLLYDAIRKVIILTARWCEAYTRSDWRQYAHNIRHIKQATRRAQNSKRGHAKTTAQQQRRKQSINDAHQQLIDAAQSYLTRAQDTIAKMEQDGYSSVFDGVRAQEIKHYMTHGDRQIDQIKRRVLQGEEIPHEEKVFSLFAPHTEWISKGKAGVPVELGLKVCILEDQHQFILHHHVMEHQADCEIAVMMVTEAQARFPNLESCSFDKGFYSQANQAALEARLSLVAMPRKGKLSLSAKAAEQAPDFVAAKQAHSAVESAINGLEVHGLDKCLDQGIDGFKRYVALAVVARNIHRIGDLVWRQEAAIAKRRERKQAKHQWREANNSSLQKAA
jgi:transposase, IS5 family